MPDKILICQHCGNKFVYSDYEQKLDAKQDKPEPIYDTICASIKAQELKRPPKPPQKS